ncbi:hypothetical protein G7054_g10466 [Neopestalotiopsis clavispora]|nr:hypothetical protein G7054_g10466 [Neopestalotiopsis clavispora]
MLTRYQRFTERDGKSVMKSDPRVHNAETPAGDAIFRPMKVQHRLRRLLSRHERKPNRNPRRDRQLLDYFRHVTWRDFAYFFDDLSWKRQLLPAIGAEPIIYHTGLAISALGWRQANPNHLWSGSAGAARSAEEYCTLQYNKAVQLFKSRMENPLDDAHALQVLILGSLMFIHLEFMRGITDFVLVHLRGANALLRSLKQRSRDTAFLEAAVAYVEAQWKGMPAPTCARPPRALPEPPARIITLVEDDEV